MWKIGWRETVWSQLDQRWDVIIIGGGITGAGIFREAVRSGLKTLLVEAYDFASGTSSRSSKLVHGGLRYLKNMQVKLTIESVKERERLLNHGKGLINRLGFVFTCHQGDSTPGWVFGLGLIAYGLLAKKWVYRHYEAQELHELCPPLTAPSLIGGYRYFDAQTDDARLTLRIIREAVQDGGFALNYARVEGLLQNQTGQVSGIILKDNTNQKEGYDAEIQAKVVINATGAWVEKLRSSVTDNTRSLRPIQGSHLIFPYQRLPLTRAVSMLHPSDRRAVFAFPWEGVTIIGTTDVDIHTPTIDINPRISNTETEYLIQFANHAFPEQELSVHDVLSSYSGIRSVVDTGKADPSKESREHVMWLENGLLTISGGKLTTFRLMARDALRLLRPYLPGRISFEIEHPILNPSSSDFLSGEKWLKPWEKLRLLGRYDGDTSELISSSKAGELSPIAGTPYLWAELRWAARAEGVVHLDDLLLRRIRLGLLLPYGGSGLMERIRFICQGELSWDDQRWQEEEDRYLQLWKDSHSI
jgi:glycerol-3-phosphate dehydrogenase